MAVPSMEADTGRIVLSTGESFTPAKSGRSFGTAPKHDARHRIRVSAPGGFEPPPLREKFASYSARQISEPIIFPCIASGAATQGKPSDRLNYDGVAVEVVQDQFIVVTSVLRD